MSKNIESRIKRIEDGLGTSKGPKVLEVIMWTDNPPPDRTENGITIRHISYKKIQGQI